jgi:hypothetical protein
MEVTRMKVLCREAELTGETRENRKISGCLPGFEYLFQTPKNKLPILYMLFD